MSDLLEMVTPAQGTARLTGAVVDLSSPRGSTTDFLHEPQGNHYPRAPKPQL